MFYCISTYGGVSLQHGDQIVKNLELQFSLSFVAVVVVAAAAAAAAVVVGATCGVMGNAWCDG